jgi:hypothetical protein
VVSPDWPVVDFGWPEDWLADGLVCDGDCVVDWFF